MRIVEAQLRQMIREELISEIGFQGYDQHKASIDHTRGTHRDKTDVPKNAAFTSGENAYAQTQQWIEKTVPRAVRYLPRGYKADATKIQRGLTKYLQDIASGKQHFYEELIDEYLPGLIDDYAMEVWFNKHIMDKMSAVDMARLAGY